MMTTSDTVAEASGSSRGTWVFGLLLAFPSFGFVQKYAGYAGVALYLAIVLAAVFLVSRYAKLLAPRLRRHFRILAILSAVALTAGFILLHPQEDGRGPGKSSDRNEGLELAFARMADGQTPYYPPRVFPGPLSLLPGSIFLAAPFSATGNSGWQNVFWLLAFLLAAARWFDDKAIALVLLTVPVAISLAAQYEFVSGGDLISNGIFIALFLMLSLTAWVDDSHPPLMRWAGCVLLGLSLASRANFILLLPLFGAAVWKIAGLRQAVIASAAVGISFLAVCLPFYLHDPAGFTPLMSKRKLANDSLPWAGSAIIVLTGVLSIAAAFVIRFGKERSTATSLFRCCAVVTLIPIVCAVVFSSIARGTLDFGFLRDRFGLMYVPFALLGWGGSWLGAIKAPARSNEPLRTIKP